MIAEQEQLERSQVETTPTERQPIATMNRSETVQATLERNQANPKRKFYIRFKIEVGMHAISSEPQPEPDDRLVTARRQEQAEQHAAVSRESAFRRLKLG